MVGQTAWVERLESLSSQEYPRLHHPSYESFSSAVKQGCWLCKRLKPRVSSSFTTSSNEPKFDERFADSWYCLSFKNDPRSDPFFIERVQPWTALHQPAETFKSQKYTGDESVAEPAKEWLTHCQN